MQYRNQDRRTRISGGGWINPDAHLKCGALDSDAKFPEPAHLGGCRGCHKALVELLAARVVKADPMKPATQLKGSWMF